MEATIKYIRVLEVESGVRLAAVSLLCVMESYTLVAYIQWLQDKIIS